MNEFSSTGQQLTKEMLLESMANFSKVMQECREAEAYGIDQAAEIAVNHYGCERGGKMVKAIYDRGFEVVFSPRIIGPGFVYINDGVEVPMFCPDDREFRRASPLTLKIREAGPVLFILPESEKP